MASPVDDPVARLFRDGLVNAVLAWAMIAGLAVVFAESLLDGDLRSIAVVTFAGAVALLPPLSVRDLRVVLPWELLLLALLPILVRGVSGGSLGRFATGLSLAALALLVVVELHMFTAFSVTHWFAVVIVVLTTLATVAVWTIFRWTADLYLGTTFLVNNESLMIEWLWIALAGAAAGVLFDTYFRRRDRQLRRAIRRLVGR